MAEPKTYRKSRTNITGWIVEKTSRVGTRTYRIRLRLVTARMSEMVVAIEGRLTAGGLAGASTVVALIAASFPDPSGHPEPHSRMGRSPPPVPGGPGTRRRTSVGAL